MTLVGSPGFSFHQQVSSYFDRREGGEALTDGNQTGGDEKGERQESMQLPIDENEYDIKVAETKAETSSKRKSVWKGLSLTFRKGKKS